MGSGTVISEGLMDQMIRIIKEGGEIILSARHIGETVTAKEGKGKEHPPCSDPRKSALCAAMTTPAQISPEP